MAKRIGVESENVQGLNVMRYESVKAQIAEAKARNLPTDELEQLLAQYKAELPEEMLEEIEQAA